MRRTDIDGVGKVVLADTVGFIRDLPHSLVEAFKATLEQVAEADLLLHVVDAAAPDTEDLTRQVDAVLEEIGAADVPTIKVLNKADLMHQNGSPFLEDECNRELARVVVSARDGTGLPALREALGRALGVAARPVTVLLNSGSGKLGHVCTRWAPCWRKRCRKTHPRVAGPSRPDETARLLGNRVGARSVDA